MVRKISAFMLAAIFCLTLTPKAPAQNTTHHVIFVVTSSDQNDWNTAMVLANHFLDGIQPDAATVEVLAYGGGIGIMAKTAPTGPQLAELQKRGVHFVACENAMRAHHILSSDLLSGVTTVPSGIVELVRKQEAGYAYVKVGE